MEHIDLQCPQCGAPLRKESTDGGTLLKCDHCGYSSLILDNAENTEQVHETPAKKSKAWILGVVALVIALLFFLTTKEKKLEVDPFQFVTVDFEGINGKGNADITIAMQNTGNVVPTEIDYTLENDRNLSNGETVLVTAGSEAYTLTSAKKEFTVEGLMPFLATLDGYTQEAFSAFEARTVASAKEQVNTGIRGATLTETVPAAVFLQTNGVDDNQLWMLVKGTFVFDDGSTGHTYFSTRFDDVVVDASGTLHYASQSMGATDVVQVASDTAVGGYLYGFQSLESAEAYIQSKQEQMTLHSLIFE